MDLQDVLSDQARRVQRQDQLPAAHDDKSVLHHLEQGRDSLTRLGQQPPEVGMGQFHVRGAGKQVLRRGRKYIGERVRLRRRGPDALQKFRLHEAFLTKSELKIVKAN